MKIVSDEVFENIVNRLNLLESKMINHNNQTDNFVNEMSDIKNSINNLNSALTLFINETTNKFIDYEYALSEIESNLELDTTNVKVDGQDDVTFINDNSDESNNANIETSEPLENNQSSTNIDENNE
jgi:hypothetical protein